MTLLLKGLMLALICLIPLSAQTQVDISTVKKFKLTEGKHLAQLKLNNSQSIQVNLSIPTIKPNKKYPLIIALHWAGGPNAYQDYSDCLAFPALDFLNGIIVAPSDSGSHWVSEYNESKLIQLIKAIKKHWPIDDSKLIITGYSNGGIASWYYAEKFPELFTAAIAISGSYEASKIDIPMYVIHGKQDELFNVYRIQNTISTSQKRGSDITFKLLQSHSHFMGCSYVDALKDMAKLMKKDVFD